MRQSGRTPGTPPPDYPVLQILEQGYKARDKVIRQRQKS